MVFAPTRDSAALREFRGMSVSTAGAYSKMRSLKATPRAIAIRRMGAAFPSRAPVSIWLRNAALTPAPANPARSFPDIPDIRAKHSRPQNGADEIGR